jgi:hypothetical protein
MEASLGPWLRHYLTTQGDDLDQQGRPPRLFPAKAFSRLKARFTRSGPAAEPAE